jgi:hypothetical protein
VIRAVARFTFAAVQALLERTDLRLFLGEASREFGFAFLGGLPQGAKEAGLLPSLQKLPNVRAMRAAKWRKRTKEVRVVGGKRRDLELRRGNGRRRGGWEIVWGIARAIPLRRHSSRSNPVISSTVGTRPLRLWVVCGDHAPR